MKIDEGFVEHKPLQERPDVEIRIEGKGGVQRLAEHLTTLKRGQRRRVRCRDRFDLHDEIPPHHQQHFTALAEVDARIALIVREVHLPNTADRIVAA